MPGAKCHRRTDCWPSGPSQKFEFYAWLDLTVGHHHTIEYVLLCTACGGELTEGGCLIIIITISQEVQALGPGGYK